MFAFLPSLAGECRSELDIRHMASRLLTRQFIGGSEESPVSTAKMCRARSPKHALGESKPDFDPSIENHGEIGRASCRERV